MQRRSDAKVFARRCTKNCPGPRTPSRTSCRTCLAGGASGDNGGTASPPKASLLPPRRRRHRRSISSRRAPTVPPSKESALPGAARFLLMISSPAPENRFRKRVPEPPHRARRGGRSDGALLLRVGQPSPPQDDLDLLPG